MEVCKIEVTWSNGVVTKRDSASWTGIWRYIRQGCNVRVTEIRLRTFRGDSTLFGWEKPLPALPCPVITKLGQEATRLEKFRERHPDVNSKPYWLK